MRKSLSLLLLLLLIGFSGAMAQGQFIQHAFVQSYVPFTPCVGQPIQFSAIDTTGNFTLATLFWNFGDGGTGVGSTSVPTASHVYTAPGTYHVYFSAWDSLGWSNTADSFYVVVDSVCSNHDNISGIAYYDANSNGVQDNGEPGYPNVLIQINPGPYYVTTDANGYWSVNMTPGTYDFSAIAPMYYSVTGPVGNNYTVTSAGNGSAHPGNDFGVAPVNGINDLRVHMYSSPPVPGFNRTIWLDYQNVGTTMLNASVTLQLDPAVTFVSASNGGTLSGNTVSWSVGNLFPGDFGYLQALVTTQLGTPIGSTITHVASILPIVGDTTPGNNVDTDSLTVVASYDPNDKSVSPQGQGAGGNIAPGTPLTYTIRFQNTGTFYATDVILRDTLDADLDYSTLEVLGSSHPMTWHLDFGKLAFEFRNIMLPDSNTNEPASHGFVSYRIRPKNTLPTGTELRNTASIYFDFNPPVVTNTTVNTIDLALAIVPGRNLVGLRVAPNPFGSYTQFEFQNPNGASYSLEVRDMSGRLLRVERGINGQQFQFDGSDLAAGLYLARLVGPEGVAATAKIIKQ